MKYIIILLSMIALSSCSSIGHKALIVSQNMTGGKIVLTDPAGGGTPLPSIVLGVFTSSIITIPPETDLFYESTAYELFSGNPIYTQKVQVKSTLEAGLKIVDKNIEYYKEGKNITE